MNKEIVEWVRVNLIPFESDLRRMLRRVCSRSDEIDDVIQEIYYEILVMESMDHVRAPRPFLMRVAKAVFLMRLRRGTIVNIECIARIEALDVEETVPSTEPVASARTASNKLLGMIANLRYRCKQEAMRGIWLVRKMITPTTTLPSMAWYEPSATLAENIDLYDDAMRQTAGSWYRPYDHEGRSPCRQASAQESVHCTRCRRHPVR